MGNAVSSIIGGGTSMLGQGIMGRAQEKSLEIGGEIQLRAYNYQAHVDDINASIVKKQTERQVAQAKKEGMEDVSAQRSRIGASGITAESFGLLTAEGLDTVYQDMDDIQRAGDIERFGYESSARFKRLQGQAAKAGAHVEAEGVKVGTAFSILGTGMSSAGSAMGKK